MSRLRHFPLIVALLCLAALPVLAQGWPFDGPGSGSGGLFLKLNGTSSMDAAAPIDGTGALLFSVDGDLAGRITPAPSPTVNGQGNVFLGEDAAVVAIDLNATDGTYNTTCLGGEACRSTTKAAQNVCVGSRSCYQNQTGGQLACVGQGACYEATGGRLSALGQHALLNATTQTQSIAIGYRAGEGAAGGTYTGDNNIYIGASVGAVTTSGGSNTVIGAQAAPAITSAGQTTAVGYQAARLVTTGARNTCLGRETCEALTTQTDATCVGNLACQAATATVTALGSGAGLVHTSGTGNTFLGFQAGYTATAANATTTGSQQTFVGYQAGQASTTQRTNATAIGYQATVDANNTVVLGNASVDHVWAASDGGATIHLDRLTSPTGTIYVLDSDTLAPESDSTSDLGAAAAQWSNTYSDTVVTQTLDLSGNGSRIGTAPTALPTCDATSEGVLAYINDTDDAKPASLCICGYLTGAGDGTLAWNAVAGSSGCP